MALIPYRDVPQASSPQLDPPLLIGGQVAEEFYCGDYACDCATVHLRIGGVVMSVDLGTRRVDFLDNQGGPARESLRRSVRDALGQGSIETLRKHYDDTRTFGKDLHFRYVDWSGVKPGELVLWQHAFRAEGIPLFTMGSEEPTGSEGEASEQKPAPKVTIGLQDAYCIEPKCDCKRVVFTVVVPQAGNTVQKVGVVNYSLVKKEPAVLETAGGVDANSLFVLVANLLSSQPQLVTMYENRYRFMREQLAPILAAQRQAKGQTKARPVVAAAQRNEACPCGSGKKYKKCHGAN
ncbi:MAG: SEC-C domain-containing protein [Myxococcales bacterium]|nr:SEC-C domain-containing protein [Myxococcales bacterium]